MEKLQITDSQCHTLLDIAKLFFAKPENKADFEKWKKERELKKQGCVNA